MVSCGLTNMKFILLLDLMETAWNLKLNWIRTFKLTCYKNVCLRNRNWSKVVDTNFTVPKTEQKEEWKKAADEVQTCAEEKQTEEEGKDAFFLRLLM